MIFDVGPCCKYFLHTLCNYFPICNRLRHSLIHALLLTTLATTTLRWAQTSCRNVARVVLLSECGQGLNSQNGLKSNRDCARTFEYDTPLTAADNRTRPWPASYFRTHESILTGGQLACKTCHHRLGAHATFPSSTCEAGSIATVIATVASHVCPSCPPCALAFRGMASNGRQWEAEVGGWHDAEAAACPSPGLQHPRSWLLIQHPANAKSADMAPHSHSAWSPQPRVFSFFKRAQLQLQARRVCLPPSPPLLSFLCRVSR